MISVMITIINVGDQGGMGEKVFFVVFFHLNSMLFFLFGVFILATDFFLDLYLLLFPNSLWLG